MLKSIKEVYEKIETMKIHSPAKRTAEDMETILSSLQKRFADKGGLPEGFVEFCELWGGRFHINHHNMNFMSYLLSPRDEEDADGEDSV